MLELEPPPHIDNLAAAMDVALSSDDGTMHDISSLRKSNAELTARIAAVQDEADKRAHQLENRNCDLELEIMHLQGQHKHAIKQEAADRQDEEKVQRLAQISLEQEAVIKKLTGDAEANKAHIHSLCAQLDRHKAADSVEKQPTDIAHEKLDKLTKKYEGLKKRFDAQGRALKKLKSRDAIPPRTKTVPSNLKQGFSVKKPANNPDKPSKNGVSHMNRGGYANPMLVNEDEDDDEELPSSQIAKMETEDMDIDDMPMRQRPSIKKEKVADHLFGNGNVKSIAEVIDIDSD